MRELNALQLRQSLGPSLDELQKTGEPILLKKGGKPIGVIVSLEDYKESHRDLVVAREKAVLRAELDALIRPAVDPTPAEVLTRQMRDAKDVDIR